MLCSCGPLTDVHSVPNLDHKPKFAILDECSSAITTHMEQRLYHLCQKDEITYITIAHRPALQAYHDKMLAIGDGEQGFTITPIANSEIKEKVRNLAIASKVPKEIEESTKAFKTARSKKYQDSSSHVVCLADFIYAVCADYF
eukprot:SAG31_NODE_1639_length_7669_cov_13.434082_6_plen_143_part_00